MYRTCLVMVLMMLSSSSLEGGLWPPMGNTRLIGSNRRERDLERQAASYGCRESFRAFSGLHKHKEIQNHSQLIYSEDIYRQEILQKTFFLTQIWQLNRHLLSLFLDHNVQSDQKTHCCKVAFKDSTFKVYKGAMKPTIYLMSHIDIYYPLIVKLSVLTFIN